MNFPIHDTVRFDAGTPVFREQRVNLPRDRLKPDVTLGTTLVYPLAALDYLLGAAAQAGQTTWPERVSARASVGRPHAEHSVASTFCKAGSQTTSVWPALPCFGTSCTRMRNFG